MDRRCGITCRAMEQAKISANACIRLPRTPAVAAPPSILRRKTCRMAGGVGFDFSGASGSVTLTIPALHGDNDTLYWCTDPSHCPTIPSGGTFNPGAGVFYFELLIRRVLITAAALADPFELAPRGIERFLARIGFTRGCRPGIRRPENLTGFREEDRPRIGFFLQK